MPAPAPRKPTALERLIICFLKLWDSTPFPWHKLPAWTVLPFMYPILRRMVLDINLIDVAQPHHTPLAERLERTQTPLSAEETPMTRVADGWGDDIEHPGAGNTGATIGRNMDQVPRALRCPGGNPHPQLVAQKLLARRPSVDNPSGFRPAGMQLNGLSANWIQTMIHDWQDHALSSSTTTLGAGAIHGCPLSRFTFQNTLDVTPANGNDVGSAYLNTRTGWWDASFLYGATAQAERRSRTGCGGLLNLPGGKLPINKQGLCFLGDQRNSQVGVGCLQVRFRA
jgi:hypothetical protein